MNSVQPVWFDSHCHFDFADFDQDRRQVWQACLAQGICQLLIPGVEPAQWPEAQSIAERHEGIYFAAAIHPWWVKKLYAEGFTDESAQELRRSLCAALEASACVAIGECGLDKGVDTPLELQEQVFDLHLQLAEQLEQPLIIHCHKAHNEVIRRLKHYKLPAGGVIHAFNGSYEMAMQYWEMGFYLGVGGTITYERANKTRSALARVPLEAILMESDAPDMPLCGHQGERNSPSWLPTTAAVLAQLRQEPLERIASCTTTNSRRLFRLPQG